MEQAVFIFPLSPVRVSGHDSAIFFHSHVVAGGLPTDPALILKWGPVGPLKVTLVIKVPGSYPELREPKVISEPSHNFLDSFVLSYITHTCQMTFFYVTTIDFRLGPRKHVTLHEDELVNSVSVVEL